MDTRRELAKASSICRGIRGTPSDSNSSRPIRDRTGGHGPRTPRPLAGDQARIGEGASTRESASRHKPSRAPIDRDCDPSCPGVASLECCNQLCLLPRPRRRSRVWVRQAAENMQTLTRNLALGEQGSQSPESGPARPWLAASAPRGIAEGSRSIPPLPPE